MTGAPDEQVGQVRDPSTASAGQVGGVRTPVLGGYGDEAERLPDLRSGGEVVAAFAGEICAPIVG
jgi:hypothetical protein